MSNQTSRRLNKFTSLLLAMIMVMGMIPAMPVSADGGAFTIEVQDSPNMIVIYDLPAAAVFEWEDPAPDAEYLTISAKAFVWKNMGETQPAAGYTYPSTITAPDGSSVYGSTTHHLYNALPYHWITEFYKQVGSQYERVEQFVIYDVDPVNGSPLNSDSNANGLFGTTKSIDTAANFWAKLDELFELDGQYFNVDQTTGKYLGTVAANNINRITRFGNETVGQGFSSSENGLGTTPVLNADKTLLTWNMQIPLTPGEVNKFEVTFNHGLSAGAVSNHRFEIPVAKTPKLNITTDPSTVILGESFKSVIETDVDAGEMVIKYNGYTQTVAVADGKAEATFTSQNGVTEITVHQIFDNETEDVRALYNNTEEIIDNINVNLAVTFVDPGDDDADPDDNKELGTKYIEPGKKLDIPTAPVKVGYEFLGWYTDEACTDGNEFDFSTVITESTDIYAKFKKIDDTYTVTYIVNNKLYGDKVTGILYNETVEFAPMDPVLAGYTFDGWYTDKDCTDGNEFVHGEAGTGTAITADTKIYAKMTPDAKVYSLVFERTENDSAAANWPENVSGAADLKVPYQMPSMTGFKFLGWSTDPTATAADDDYAPGYIVEYDGLTADVTLYAVWEKIVVYNVSFDRTANDVDATNWPGNISGTGELQIPFQNPAMTGKVFLGWTKTEGDTTVDYEAGDSVDAGDYNASSLTLYAVWEDDEVTVTFPTAPYISGIESIVDDTDTTLTTLDVVRGDTVEFYVVLATGYDPAALKVSANGENLGYIDSEAVTDGVKYHYSFKAEDDTVISIADVQRKQYTITLPYGDSFSATFTECEDADGNPITAAEGRNSFTFNYGDTFKVDVLPRVGYKATMKVDGNEDTVIKDITVETTPHVSDEYTVTDAHTVTIEINEIVFYTITYVVDGKQMTTRQVEIDTDIPFNVNAPVKTGYDFDGWYLAHDFTGNKNELGKAAAHLEVYGRYVAVEGKIHYEMNAGSDTTDPASIADTSKLYGMSVTLDDTVPTREGYDFLGWAYDENATTAVYAPGATYSTELPFVDTDGDDKPDTYEVTLYAVWKIKTYTITFIDGSGYSVKTTQSTTVEHGDDFDFSVIVDRDYAATAPTVELNTAHTLTLNDGETSDTTAAEWEYTIEDVTENIVVTISVTENQTWTVTFKYDTSDDNASYEDVAFATQEVEHGYKAVQPAMPVLEGYTFEKYVWDEDGDGTAEEDWDFGNDIVDNTEIFAVMNAITPEVNLPDPDGEGWITWFDSENVNVKNKEYAYGDDCYFYVQVLAGYDASGLVVTVNGKEWKPVETVTAGDVTTNKYLISKLEIEEYNVTVTGIERRTVTITYNANSRDDVSGMPVYQVVKYYLDGDYDYIDDQKPVRTGYTFLGWSTDSEATAADYEPGDVADFIKDTVLYAIWEAKSVTVTLDIEGSYDPDYTAYPNANEFEGEEVTLVATVNAEGNVQGSITFWRETIMGVKEMLGTADVVGNRATLTVKVGTYENENANDKFGTRADWLETYWIEFTPVNDEGYEASPEALKCLRVWSKALAWATPRNLGIDDNANVLTIYAEDGTTTVTEMEANKVYYLEIPTVYPFNANFMPKVGVDYYVVWEYLDPNNDWVELTTITDSNRLKVEAEYAQYSFRAKVYPTETGIFTKAVEYAADGTITDDATGVTYIGYLITVATDPVELRETVTDLEITGADLEPAGTLIFGEAKFVNDHLAQFEGQNITLKAYVIEKDSKANVNTGIVYFYRYTDDGVDGNDELLNATAVSVVNGIAELKDVTVKNYDADGYFSSTSNIDRFYAVYETNETYEGSASVAKDGDNYVCPGAVTGNRMDCLFVKATTIKTPIIESLNDGTVAGATGNRTTWEDDLEELLAGIEHQFTLVEGEGQSVVAIDGRATTDYEIEWYVKDGDNTETSAADGKTFTTSTNHQNYEVFVRLNPIGDMVTGADSMRALINSRQNVVITVIASDEIPYDTEIDVYQLDEITLTAIVDPEKTDASVLPTKTVAFFYYDEDAAAWVYLGEDDLEEDTDGHMKAEITTTELPVSADGTYRDLVISVTYEGDETFVDVADQEAACITPEEVRVYSSVVLVDEEHEENKLATTQNGIIISVIDGAVLSGETDTTLELGPIHTLDKNLAAEEIALMKYGIDYTVQWQELEDANAYSDFGAASTPWKNIDGETENTCGITVKQGFAYRAMITVIETDKTRASYDEVDRDGRTYFSNVLVAGLGEPSVSININTSDVSEGNEGIVEGETVTIHTFISGATETTPISAIEVVINDEDGNEVYCNTENDVNGHVSFDWTTEDPGYYYMTVTVSPSNGYEDIIIERTLIVRDSDFGFEFDAASLETVYNGRPQFAGVSVIDMDIEDTLANELVVIYYYDMDGNMVEPIHAGTYTAVARLQESQYWTEGWSEEVTFTILPRKVSVVDLVAQTKIYDDTTDINELEIVLEKAVTDQVDTGLPTDDRGLLPGDSLFATGVMTIDGAAAGEHTLSVSGVELFGDDVNNYELDDTSYTEDIYVLRNQVKGSVAKATYEFGTSAVPAEDIYLIDQLGNVLDEDDYEIFYYYHHGDGVRKVSSMSWFGMYTVIVRPEQDNYKGGASAIVYVAEEAIDADPDTNFVSTLITIEDTVELYDDDLAGVTVTVTSGDAEDAEVKYFYDGAWTEDIPEHAGRYLVKVTADTGDVAYGIYTIVKADPDVTIEAEDMEYNSGIYDYDNLVTVTGAEGSVYYTWTGGTIQGISYQAPTQVGEYVVTAHIGETADHSAYEVSTTFEITRAPLVIIAEDIQRHQYSAYPATTFAYEGLATGGIAPDTSLRDIQIAPEMIFDAGFTNDAADQVGNYTITPASALARNYEIIEYRSGNISVTENTGNPELAIRGMIDNGTTTENIAYFGDKIQLYPYGNQVNNVMNDSSIYTWTIEKGPATIGEKTGLLEITGVGEVIVRLTRGNPEGARSIYTEITIDARAKEIWLDVEDDDKVYNGNEQEHEGTVTVIGEVTGTDAVYGPVGNTNKATDVGSQIAFYNVDDGNYVSENYGGLYTINYKEVTVYPENETEIYGDLEEDLTYSADGEVAGKDVFVGDGASVAITDSYINLDANTAEIPAIYEILVGGTEFSNYNVSYSTEGFNGFAIHDKEAGISEIEELDLEVITGFYTGTDKFVGMTSGSKVPKGYYPAKGEVVEGATFETEGERMYGEPNHVMGFELVELIDGDSMADIADLVEWIVYFETYNIGIDANLEYDTRDYKDGFEDVDYEIEADIDMVNYKESVTMGIQNVFQRPVTLTSTLPMEAFLHDIINSNGTVNVDYLLELILVNMEVGEYEYAADQFEGGLAELLGHTIMDLDIQIDSATYDAANGKISVQISLGNKNYWLDPTDAEFDVTVTLSKLLVVYNSVEADNARITVYTVDENNVVGDPATNISGDVIFYIYERDDEAADGRGYAYYKTTEAVRTVTMTPGRSDGVYRAYYDTLPEGSYVVFAIANNYTIIE